MVIRWPDGASVLQDDEALRRLSQLARSDEYQLRSVFSPGELVAFDNRRILHGRGPFSEATGRRVLRGAYVDHDEVYSRLRVLTRRHEIARMSAVAEPNPVTQNPVREEAR